MCVLPRPEDHRPSGTYDLCWDGQKWRPSQYGDFRLTQRGTGKTNHGQPGHEHRYGSQARREKFLIHVTEHGSIQDACLHVPISYSGYQKWRKLYPQFAAEVDLARGISRQDRMEYLADFATFRRLYLGMDTTWFQQHAVKALENAVPGEIILMLWPPEHGKAECASNTILHYSGGMNLPVITGSPIPTHPTWSKIGDLVPGDFVFGRDGKPTRVLGVYPQGTRPCRRVWFSDRTHLDVDVDHLWWVKDRNRDVKRTPKQHYQGTMTTADIEARLRNESRRTLSVPVAEALQLPEADLPIDPWLLGYWLGNGATSGGILSCHAEDFAWVTAKVRDAGWAVNPDRKYSGSAPTLGVYKLRPALRELGVLGFKHIPDCYLFASESQRRALLAGLLDSDGYAGGARGQIQLCFTNKRLAEDALLLVRTLGLKPTHSERPAGYKINGVKKITGTAYSLWLTMRDCLFTSPRKSAMWRPTAEAQGDRLRWRYIERIEELPDTETVCIKVEADDSLYLAGDELVVTHNTTLIEDFINMKLALDPSARITVVSERKDHSVKILRRVRNRMEPAGPAPNYVLKFGPFVPDEKDGRRAGAQPWAADHFDVRLRGVFDERDFNLAGVGINTAIQGQRADWLIIDDCQSLKSANLTNDYVEKLRQDFFSRPGMFGRICLLGTRICNEDVYETLIDAGLIDKLIVFPAYKQSLTGEVEWLWPQRYTPEMYEGMRKRVGEQAWARNYMQRPSAAKDSTFDRDMIAGCHNEARSVIADCPREGANMTRVCVSLDPSLGGANAITALGFHTKRLLYLSSRVDHGLTRNEQIFDLLEQTIIRWNHPGISRVHEVVIEANAFQKGLLDDDRIREIIRRYGVRVIPHITGGTNKHDPNIGVASMALSFMRGEIDLPYSDKVSREEISLFTAEFCAWVPTKRGNILRQDRVMSFWFGYLRWKSQRAAVGVDPSQFSTKASPLRVGA